MVDLYKNITEYLTYCDKQKKLSKHTIKAYKIDLFQFYSYKENIDISKKDLTCYIQYLHEKFKPKTIRRKIASIKAFIHYLYYEEIIDNNPFDKIDDSFKEPLLLPRTIPAHIIQNLLVTSYGNIKSATTNNSKYIAIRDTSVLELLFATGARISEICSLKPENIDLDSQTIRIIGKGSKERIIEIENYDVLSILKRYYTIFREFFKFCVNYKRRKMFGV